DLAFPARAQERWNGAVGVDANGCRALRAVVRDRSHAGKGTEDRVCADARVRTEHGRHPGPHQETGWRLMRTATRVEAASLDRWAQQRDFAVEAEKLGLDVLWVAEAWGSDAPSALGY